MARVGLGGAQTATVRIEWPNGTVQTFNNVASNRLYRATQGGTLAAVTPGGAPAYQCGPPTINAGALSHGRAIDPAANSWAAGI